jgi:uncharacterized protein YndB with AHSA1/START domain
MQHVEVTRQFAAPIERVFDRYTDHVSWTQWAGLGKVVLARQGVPAPNGVGCVRAITTAGVGVHEEVLEFEPPKRMTYRVVKGAVPMKDHLGEVLFQSENGGTRVTWRCQFNSKIPGLGGVQRWFITRLFRTALEGLARDLAVP